MTNPNIPTCERCGTPKAFPETDLGCPLCPLPESACRSIAALHSEVEALRKREEGNGATIKELMRGLARALVERDSALKARDEALDQVVVLRESLEGPGGDTLRGWAAWLEDRAEALDPYIQRPHMLGIAAWVYGLDETFSNTSTLAEQRKREIQREALRDYGHHMQAIPELGVEGCGYDPEQGIPCTCGLAAILTPEGPDAKTENK